MVAVNCFHCYLRDRYVQYDQVLHDLFLNPHGLVHRGGECDGITEEDVSGAVAACPFCPKITVCLPD